jgi:hypothetical protein
MAFNPENMATGNFKRDYGFTQGRGKLGAEHIKKCVEEVDKISDTKDGKDIEYILKYISIFEGSDDYDVVKFDLKNCKILNE